MNELDDLGKLCMEKNVWKVCEYLCSRIDGEPGPHGDMTAYVTERKGISFISLSYHFHQFYKMSGFIVSFIINL